jgi:hypothetical protein
MAMVGRRGAALVALALVAGSAQSKATRRMATGEAEIATCIRRAASGRAWLEKTLWGLRDQEAGWIGAQIANRNGTHDLGPLQVNSWWVTRIAPKIGREPADVRHWLTHDACFNVEAARWIFLTALASTGDYWSAVGIYHSPTKWRRQQYAADVAARLKKRFGSRIFQRPEHE